MVQARQLITMVEFNVSAYTRRAPHKNGSAGPYSVTETRPYFQISIPRSLDFNNAASMRFTASFIHQMEKDLTLRANKIETRNLTNLPDIEGSLANFWEHVDEEDDEDDEDDE